MAAYLFSDLLANPALTAAFDPVTDTLNLQAPANRVAVLRDGPGLAFTTAAGTVVLPVSWEQIANPAGSSDIIICASGRLVVGDNAVADNHVVASTAGDQFHGRGGDDQFTGNLGDDIAYGNKGSDFLFGSAGDDTLYGG